MTDKAKKKKKKRKKAAQPGATGAPELHPLVATALGEMRRGEGDSLLIRPEGAAAVKGALGSFLTQPKALVEAVQALLVFAYYLDKQRDSGPAAEALLEVARSAIPELQRLGVDVQEALSQDNLERSDVGAQFQKLVGEERYKADPRIDKAPAAGGGVLGLLVKKDK